VKLSVPNSQTTFTELPIFRKNILTYSSLHSGTEPEDIITEEIVKRSSALLRIRQNEIKILNKWVGLRPGRVSGVRIEAEYIDVGTTRILIVHNYGHGGCGKRG